MIKRTVQHNNFDIDVIKNDENVLITCLDKQMNKTYQESFTNSYTREVFTINNFFNIINYAFDNNAFTVMTMHDYIIIHITYNSELVFNVELRLPLIYNTQLTNNTIYTKKLEEEIEELKRSATICIGTRSIYNWGSYISIPIIVPVYVDLIVVTRHEDDSIFNVYNLTSDLYYDVTYEYGINRIIIYVKNKKNDKYREQNRNFHLLRPKKIEFNNIIIGSIDYSFFPREC